MRAFTGSGPQTARRTSDARERSEWERQQQVAAEPDRELDQRMQAYREQRDREKADEQHRIREGNERYRQAVEADKKAVADREAKRRADTEERTARLLLAGMFDSHAASEIEQNRVRQIVEQHPPEQRTLDLYQVTLLKLRAELEGDVPEGQPDWRDSLRREDA